MRPWSRETNAGSRRYRQILAGSRRSRRRDVKRPVRRTSGPARALVGLCWKWVLVVIEVAEQVGAVTLCRAGARGVLAQRVTAALLQALHTQGSVGPRRPCARDRLRQRGPARRRWGGSAQRRSAASISKRTPSSPAAARELGHADGRGPPWRHVAPVHGRRFELIVANLPHFPMDGGDVAAGCRPGARAVPMAGTARSFPRRARRHLYARRSGRHRPQRFRRSRVERACPQRHGCRSGHATALVDMPPTSSRG